MKIFQKFGVGLAFILTFPVLAIAQTKNNQSSTPNKIAIIDTKVFEDKEKGIKQLVEAYTELYDEFKPQETEKALFSKKIFRIERRN